VYRLLAVTGLKPKRKNTLMQIPQIFELPRENVRIWDLDVPIVVESNNKSINAYISGKIEEPHMYNELCYLLGTADKETSFYLHINTPGGIIDSAFMIADAIDNSDAAVIACLSGTVASAGTIIAMSCDSLEISNNLSFMIHNYSGGISGKGHEMRNRQRFTDTHLNQAFRTFYSGFLKETEMAEVIEGADLWMGTEEVRERWESRVDYVNSNAKEVETNVKS